MSNKLKISNYLDIKFKCNTINSNICNSTKYKKNIKEKSNLLKKYFNIVNNQNIIDNINSKFKYTIVNINNNNNNNKQQRKRNFIDSIINHNIIHDHNYTSNKRSNEKDKLKKYKNLVLINKKNTQFEIRRNFMNNNIDAFNNNISNSNLNFCNNNNIKNNNNNNCFVNFNLINNNLQNNRSKSLICKDSSKLNKLSLVDSGDVNNCLISMNKRIKNKFHSNKSGILKYNDNSCNNETSNKIVTDNNLLLECDNVYKSINPMFRINEFNKLYTNCLNDKDENEMKFIIKQKDFIKSNNDKIKNILLSNKKKLNNKNNNKFSINNIIKNKMCVIRCDSNVLNKSTTKIHCKNNSILNKSNNNKIKSIITNNIKKNITNNNVNNMYYCLSNSQSVKSIKNKIDDNYFKQKTLKKTSSLLNLYNLKNMLKFNTIDNSKKQLRNKDNNTLNISNSSNNLFNDINIQDSKYNNNVFQIAKDLTINNNNNNYNVNVNKQIKKYNYYKSPAKIKLKDYNISYTDDRYIKDKLKQYKSYKYSLNYYQKKIMSELKNKLCNEYLKTLGDELKSINSLSNNKKVNSNNKKNK